MKNILKFCMLFAIVASCTQPEVGYLSDNIHSKQDTIAIPRGVFISTPTPQIEGSTYPLHWEISGITDKDGNETDELLVPYEILTWKSAFNPNTDTTLEKTLEKLELKDYPSILLNDVSGQFAFTQASKNVTNDIFHISLKATNAAGTANLDDFTVIKMEPFKPVEFRVAMRSRLNLVKKVGGGLTALYTSQINNDFDDQVPSVLDGTHPYITIQKISDEPTLGFKGKMIITDSYGAELNPSEVLFYPNGPTFLQNYHDNSVETTVDDTSTTFELPAPPFPQYSRTYGGDINSYLMYYITSRNAFTVDTAAYEADYGVTDWSPFMNDSGEIVNQAYIRWGVKINDTGTWEMKMKIPYTIKK